MNRVFMPEARQGEPARQGPPAWGAGASGEEGLVGCWHQPRRRSDVLGLHVHMEIRPNSWLP